MFACEKRHTEKNTDLCENKQLFSYNNQGKRNKAPAPPALGLLFSKSVLFPAVR